MSAWVEEVKAVQGPQRSVRLLASVWELGRLQDDLFQAIDLDEQPEMVHVDRQAKVLLDRIEQQMQDLANELLVAA